MKHGSLFSGIGGFDLAAQWAGWDNIFQVEIDEWCQKLLAQNFPTTKKYTDVRDFDGAEWRGSVDVISGGFPCQPYSSAGKRLGKEDERHLWPEMLRIIREAAPSWVVGENVRGLVNWSEGLVFEEVCADLEASGYEVQPFILPAAGVNAPHQRQRVWFVAHANGRNDRRNTGELSTQDGRQGRINLSELVGSGKIHDVAHANSNEPQKRPQINAEWEDSAKNKARVDNRPARYGNAINATNANNERQQEHSASKESDGKGRTCGYNAAQWDEYPTKSGVCRGDDGIPNRVDRIKGLGNAVVPQVVFQIFDTINKYNKSTTL